MAKLSYCTFEEFGKNAFCVQDYKGFIFEDPRNQSYTDDEIDNFNFAGMVLFDGDWKADVAAFIYMAARTNPHIICIDWSNLTEDDKAKELVNFMLQCFENEPQYVNLKSYEARLAFGRNLNYKEEII